MFKKESIPKQANKIIINLFGMGVRYWICELPFPVYDELNKIKVKHKVEWENLLFDFDVLNRFGYQHWRELSTISEQSGFLLDQKNRIELKQGSKIKASFSSIELLQQQTLFPLYTTNYTNTTLVSPKKVKTLVLMQQETGLFAKFELITNEFLINELTFQIGEVANMLILNELRYTNKVLKSKSDDTIVTGCMVFEP